MGHVKNSSQLVELGYLSAEEAKEKLDYIGDRVRMDTYSDALSLWQKHPILGAGLGAFRDYQTNKRGKFSDIVDCTGLWLLSETGLVGLLGFGIFPDGFVEGTFKNSYW
jgi:O-antigen ligase